MSHTDQVQYDRQIAYWLLFVCAAIFIMLVIGGATRLTHSGLSMMTWDPLMGWIPPLSEAAWLESFKHYKQIPEFYELNPNMDLEGYKGIFMLEYIHRVWGRLIGIFFLLPFLYFLIAGKISKPLRPQLVIMFALGGMQGVLGWYMVSSGFDQAHVSQYRLTAHLMAAFAIFAYILWVAAGLLFPKREPSLYDVKPLFKAVAIVTLLIAVTIAAGGFVAGLKAGFAYNTFPLMGGNFIPEGYGMLQPYYLNWFENIAAVQFNHRLLAETVLLLVIGLFLYSRRFELVGAAKMGMHLMLGMVVIQFCLGVATLLSVVNLHLGVAHQGGAMVLFAFSLFTLRMLQSTEK
ncbi:heme A synthase [Mariprofundus sp. NF]|uniref:COX15/CtaA family protein n=1 Tax=Mariprofundus sp. NF TaxID=2608716 RepID=UPI0015A25763|nr:COX15/CtaA family protein [Mariprofundus sp. NF]NWF38746.1 heme A synthase [Mariprofundus sp. NF]